jgi:hypothetical protein
MPDQTQQLADLLTAQLMTTIQSPLLEIASCFQNAQDDDGSWDNCTITENVYEVLARLGVIKRCAECDFDFAWGAKAEPELWHCPNLDNHKCSGCEQLNCECTCDQCGNCGYNDCECPACENCEYSIYDCSCSEADKIWPANAET